MKSNSNAEQYAPIGTVSVKNALSYRGKRYLLPLPSQRLRTQAPFSTPDSLFPYPHSPLPLIHPAENLAVLPVARPFSRHHPLHGLRAYLGAMAQHQWWSVVQHPRMVIGDRGSWFVALGDRGPSNVDLRVCLRSLVQGTIVRWQMLGSNPRISGGLSQPSCSSSVVRRSGRPIVGFPGEGQSAAWTSAPRPGRSAELSARGCGPGDRTAPPGTSGSRRWRARCLLPRHTPDTGRQCQAYSTWTWWPGVVGNDLLEVGGAAPRRLLTTPSGTLGAPIRGPPVGVLRGRSGVVCAWLGKGGNGDKQGYRGNGGRMVKG